MTKRKKEAQFDLRDEDLEAMKDIVGEDAELLKGARYLFNSQVAAGTITSYNTSSDARLKENVALADDAANLIDAIQVRKFDWKADGSHQRYGFVAQELAQVAPEAVAGDPEGDAMLGVDYSKLVPMLVKEIQSLRARVAQLETSASTTLSPPW